MITVVFYVKFLTVCIGSNNSVNERWPTCSKPHDGYDDVCTYNGENKYRVMGYVYDQNQESLFGAFDLDESDETNSTDTNSVMVQEQCVYKEKKTQEFVNKTVSLLLWNVNGLISKIFDRKFTAFLSTSDFVCLVETFIEIFSYYVFTDRYDVYVPPEGSNYYSRFYYDLNGIS